MTLSTTWCVCLGAALLSADGGIPYDHQQQCWLIDPEANVARTDMLYTTPSVEPWEAMPVGGGDLSAMVRWDGSLHLHLSKSDCIRFATEPGGAYLLESTL